MCVIKDKTLIGQMCPDFYLTFRCILYEQHVGMNPTCLFTAVQTGGGDDVGCGGIVRNIFFAYFGNLDSKINLPRMIS